MALILRDLKISVQERQDESCLVEAVARRLDCSVHSVRNLAVKKRSLDARRKSDIVYVYQVTFESAAEGDLLQKARNLGIPASQFAAAPQERDLSPTRGLCFSTSQPLGSLFRHPPVVIGSGPAGSFAALVLADAGVPCRVIERGERVEARTRTVNRLLRSGDFSAESNYCFGEGGAGTFSDGKLSCGRNHPLIDFLFRRWVDFGAPEDILWEAHPHIGTDHLLRIAVNMRRYMQGLGTEFHFSTRLDDLLPGDSTCRFRLRFSDGQVCKTDHVILAVGHSARDTYEMLHARGLAMAQKPFALGARFEHPQATIDEIQYGSCAALPAAEYKLTAQAKGRGIWTFCMCPGGHLLPTSAQAGHLAINGMSYHARKSGFANAAVVVNIQREDFDRGHVLDGVRFQQALEQRAFEAGGGGYFSPAQRMTDFLAGQASRGELRSTYKPGVTSARLDRILPEFVVEALRAGLQEYNKRMRGYLTADALVAGVESKTSSPLVMTRDRTLQSVSHQGLYPSGEGAGFAGGIVSASLDGVRVAREVLKSLPGVAEVTEGEHS